MNPKPRPWSRGWRLVLALIAALPLAACNPGGECWDCDDDDDCDDGLYCASFQGGHHFCADDDTESCAE